MEMIPAIAAAFAEGAPAAGVGAEAAGLGAGLGGGTAALFGPEAGSMGAGLLGGLGMPAGATATGLGLLGPAGMAAAAPALGVGGGLVADAATSGLPATMGSTLMGMGQQGLNLIGQHPLAAMYAGNSLMQQKPPEQQQVASRGPMPQPQTVPSSAILGNFYGNQPQAQGPQGAPSMPGIGLGNYLIRKRLGLLGLGGF